MRSNPVGLGAICPAIDTPSAVASSGVPSAARIVPRRGRGPERAMHRLAAPQTRQPQRRVPHHADVIPGPRNRQRDRAAEDPEFCRPHPYTYRDLSVVITAELPEAHPANARRPIRAAIRRREPSLGMRRPRRRRQRVPHRRPVPPRPTRQEPLGGGAAAPITARDRTPYEQPTHNRRHDHQHAEHPHTATRTRSAADRPPPPSAAPPSAGPATTQQHRPRPRPRHHITRTTTTHHQTLSPNSPNDRAFPPHPTTNTRQTARTPNQSLCQVA